MERFFSEDQFGRLDALLRRERKMHTQQREAVRLFVEAISWMSRSGAQWRLLPAGYGRWNSVYQRFARWDDLGVWERLFDQVADEPDMQRVMIDAPVVRAHACAAGAPKKPAARRRKSSGGHAAGSARRSMCSSMPSATRSSSS